MRIALKLTPLHERLLNATRSWANVYEYNKVWEKLAE